MNKDLDEFVKSNRSALDTDTPPDELLDGILERWQPQKPDRSWMWKAASVVLLISTSYLLYLQLTPEINDLGKAKLGHISSEYHLLEQNYEQDIDRIQASIDLTSIDEDEYDWILEEITYLDQVNEQFRSDINSQANQEKLVAALVDYYEKKLKLLKRLELEINRNNHEKETDISI